MDGGGGERATAVGYPQSGAPTAGELPLSRSFSLKMAARLPSSLSLLQPLCGAFLEVSAPLLLLPGSLPAPGDLPNLGDGAGSFVQQADFYHLSHFIAEIMCLRIA